LSFELDRPDVACPDGEAYVEVLRDGVARFGLFVNVTEADELAACFADLVYEMRQEADAAERERLWNGPDGSTFTRLGSLA
jgi:hypothetical protein